MSAAENPNLQVVPDPARQLPPAKPSLPPTVAAAANWVGRSQVRIAEFFTSAYRGSRNGSVALAESIRDRSQRIKEQNPTALLAGIAGTAFALGIVARVLKSRR
jgi:hypothetical protein